MVSDCLRLPYLFLALSTMLDLDLLVTDVNEGSVFVRVRKSLIIRIISRGRRC